MYINGVLVSHPDILNDGLLAIHGVDKLLLDLDLDHSNYDTTAGAPVPAMMSPSPSSSASPGPDHPLNVITPFMLQDAALSLRDRGYSILALAMRIKSPELLRLQNLTIFTLSDDSVFSSEGQEFSNNVRYHVVPNMRLPLADLVQLPAGTRLKTLLHGQSLVVSDSKPFSVNYVGIKIADVFSNRWIVVHEILRPLISSVDPMEWASSDSSEILRSLLMSSEDQMGFYRNSSTGDHHE